MGNQNGKAEATNSYFQEEIDILKWRADPQHNTHIARTLTADRQQSRICHFQKVINSQLSNKTFINLSNLRRFIPQPDEAAQLSEILQFQEYEGSLEGMEDSLTIEENIYVLNALLLGYEKIYSKFSQACVHQKCCFITSAGEVRAWIHSNPACCRPDSALIKQQEKHGCGKILCSTEASICTNVLELSLRLSNKCLRFIQFYQQVNGFIKQNILHNLNFSAIRTFLNGFVYRHRLTIKNNMLSALQRHPFSSNLFQKQQQNRLTLSQAKDKIKQSQVKSAYSLKSHKMETFMHKQQPHSQQQAKKNEEQPRQSLLSSQKSIRYTSKSIQTSQIDECDRYGLCVSTQMQTPKKSSHISPNNQLICSEIIWAKQAQEHCNNSSQTGRFFKSNKGKDPSKFSKWMQADQNECPDNKSVVVQVNQNNQYKKLVRFHSHHPSFHEEDDVSNCALAMPLKQREHGTHYSLTQSSNVHNQAFSNQTNINEQQGQVQFSNSRVFLGRHQSRALTRVVSNLVSNKDLNECESVGSLPSVQNSQKSDYAGILLAMGRSIKILNQPTKKRLSVSHRGVFSASPHGAAYSIF